MALTLPTDTKDYDLIELCDDGSVSNCTSPAGHCFGSDGGTGIPDNLKVAKDRGGEFELWKLNAGKTKVLKKYKAIRCQYCQKYNISQEI